MGLQPLAFLAGVFALACPAALAEGAKTADDAPIDGVSLPDSSATRGRALQASNPCAGFDRFGHATTPCLNGGLCTPSGDDGAGHRRMQAQAFTCTCVGVRPNAPYPRGTQPRGCPLTRVACRVSAAPFILRSQQQLGLGALECPLARPISGQTAAS